MDFNYFPIYFNYFALSQENPPHPEPAAAGAQDTYMDHDSHKVDERMK